MLTTSPLDHLLKRGCPPEIIAISEVELWLTEDASKFLFGSIAAAYEHAYSRLDSRIDFADGSSSGLNAPTLAPPGVCCFIKLDPAFEPEELRVSVYRTHPDTE